MKLVKKGNSFLIVCDCESEDISVSRSPKAGTRNHYNVICNECENEEVIPLNDGTVYINRY
jgi:hypothetical protein